MKKTFPIAFALLPVLVLILSACAGKDFQTNPVTKMMNDMRDEKMYTVILQDIDLDVPSDQHQHKYSIIKEKNGQLDHKVTDWVPVDEDFFALHEDDLGMEILSKHPTEGTNRIPTPPGFTNFVGNEKYGSWAGDSAGNQTWAFAPAYAALPTMLGTVSDDAIKAEHDEFVASYYLIKPYYGRKKETRAHYGSGGYYVFLYRRPWLTRRTSKGSFYRRGGFSTSGSGRRGGGGFGK